jgi:hypothetical protein
VTATASWRGSRTRLVVVTRTSETVTGVCGRTAERATGSMAIVPGAIIRQVQEAPAASSRSSACSTVMAALKRSCE